MNTLTFLFPLFFPCILTFSLGLHNIILKIILWIFWQMLWSRYDSHLVGMMILHCSFHFHWKTIKIMMKWQHLTCLPPSGDQALSARAFLQRYNSFSLLFIFRKLPHFTVVQPLKSGKDDAISQYNDIQNLRWHLVSHHNINILPSPIPEAFLTLEAALIVIASSDHSVVAAR